LITDFLVGGRERTVPTTDSHRRLAAVREEKAAAPAAPRTMARRRTPIFIVASPRPQVGKTFLARLLTDFLRLDGGEAVAFDLNPTGDAPGNRGLAAGTDLTDVRRQMALFDCLIVEDGIAKVIDLGHGWFAQFFKVVEEIGFIDEACRRAIEPVILFAADPHPVSFKAHADLQRRFPRAVVAPVFNEAIVQGRKLRDQFAVARAAAVPLQIPLLLPILKAQADKSAHSFADFHARMPEGVPQGLAVELHAWTRRTFLEFRELELRLLLEKLQASLGPAGRS
jgi:hypothetical protein